MNDQALRAHFQGAVLEAVKNQGVEATPASCAYLSALLLDFTHAAAVPAPDPEVRFLHRPLAELLAGALAVRGAERLARLRMLGDLSLWVSGYFPDALSRRTVDVSYYIAIGGHAYQRIAMDLGGGGPLYDELARNFARFVDVLTEVSATDAGRPRPGVLRLFELWQRTKSAWAARRLGDLGVVPQEDDPDGGLQ